MSYIPDCRPKYAKDVDKPYADRGEKPSDTEINPYWFGLLDETDKEFLRGYDYNTGNVVNNLFDNMDVYATEFDKIGIDVDDIDEKIINGTDPFNEVQDERDCKLLDDYSVDELDKRSEATRVCLLMKSIINHYIEMNRDELVTSMIENMDDTEY